MTSASEVQQQIQTQQQKFQQAEQQLKQQQPTFSQAQLRQFTPQQSLQAQQSFQQRKEQALTELGARKELFQQQVTPIQEQIQQVQAAQREAGQWEQAKALISKGKPEAAIGSELQSKVQQLLAGGYGAQRTVADVQSAKEFKEFQEKLKSGEVLGMSTREGEEFFEVVESPSFKDITTPPETSISGFIPGPQSRIPEYRLPEFQVRDSFQQTGTVGGGQQLVDVRGKPQTFSSFALLDVPTKGVGFATGKIAKVLTPEFKLTMPATEIPQRATVGAKLPSFEEQVYTSKQISESIGKTAGTLGTYALIPSEALLVGGTIIATQKDVPMQERIEGLTLAGFGAVGVGGKVGKFIQEPIIGKRLPIGEPTYKVTDIGKTITKDGKEFQRATFKIVRDTPAQYGVETTRFAESPLGTGIKRLSKFEKRHGIESGGIGQRLEGGLIPKPKKVKIGKAQRDVAWTPEPLIIEKGVLKEPSYFVTMKVAKKPSYVTAFKLKGEQIPFEVTEESFKQLSKTRQFGFQKLVEERLGQPVPLKEVPKLLPKDWQASLSQVEAERLFRVFPKKGKATRIWKPGKDITRAELTSITKEVKPVIETEVKFFKTRTAVKDVTKPFARATGRVPILKGKSIILPGKDITPSGSWIKPKKVSTATKQISATRLGLIEVAIKVLPKPTRVKIPKPKSLTKVEIKPSTGISMVGTFQMPKSKWYGVGKGVEETQYIKSDTKIIEPTIIEGRIEPVFVTTTGDIQITKPRVRETQGSVLDTEIISKTIDLTKQVPKVDTLIKTSQKQVPKLKVGQKMTQKMTQKQVPRMAPRTTSRPIGKPRPPKKPRERYRPDLPDDSKTPKYIKKLKKPELVTPFVRRYGKFVPLTGRPVTKRKAIRIGTAKLKTTLAATLQLRRPSGEIVPIKPRTTEFRSGKTAPSIVQRAQFRLGTAQERLEIIKSRRGIKLIS